MNFGNVQADSEHFFYGAVALNDDDSSSLPSLPNDFQPYENRKLRFRNVSFTQ